MPQPVVNNRLGQWQNLFFRYDARGNLIQRRHGLHQQHYSYDADNRLIAASGTGPEGKFTARYRYDALGRRIAKAVTTQRGTVETRFLWEGWRLLQSREGERCATYLYDPNETWSPLARVEHPAQAQDGECYWFTAALNGAPLEVTDADGAVRWSGQYGSFGEVSHQTAESWALRQGKPTINQPLRYAGQYADSETGLHYNLFRYYDPGVGRFTTQDPIGLNGGLNLYQYAPNPLGWVDPLGLSSCSTQFASRNAAFRAAKRDAGIPMGQRPDKVFNPKTGFEGEYKSVRMTNSNGDNILTDSGDIIWTREYQFSTAGGKKVIIQDHAAGHYSPDSVGNQGAHFNVRPSENTRTGSVLGTLEHYSY
ncbi:RHS domain-containing protein [Enterobacteriaceae bacterium BIT-l23]|nr:RHS domain-containing protein [Enterobacteriaceae bacterium BIT-l23]